MTRKIPLILILTSCLYVCSISIKAQSAVQQSLDSLKVKLAEHQAQDSFELYYASLKSFEDNLSREEFENFYAQTNKLFNYLPQNGPDSSFFRKQLMNHGYKIKAYFNDYYGSKFFYEQASQYAPDQIGLDKYVWWIENDLGNIYSRLNEYDKAIFYLKKAERALTINDTYGKLPGIYPNLGLAYSFNGDETQMVSSFEKAIELAKPKQDYETLFNIQANYADYYIDNELFLKGKKHLGQAKELLSNIKQLHDYEEYVATIKNIESKLFEQQGDLKKASYLQKENLSILEHSQVSKRSREQAQVLNSLARISLKLGNLVQANNYIQKGYRKLNPNITNQAIPAEQFINTENTFCDLLAHKAEYYFQLSNTNQKHIDSCFLALNNAFFANDQLDKLLIQNPSKYISIETNRKLVDQGIAYCMKFQGKSEDRNYIHQARELFDRSKSILLKENQQRRYLLDSLSIKERRKLENIEKEIYSCYQSKYNSNQDSLGNRLTELYEELNKHSPSLSNAAHLFRLKESYLEYLVASDKVYLYTNIGKEQLLELGETKKLMSLIDSVFEEINNRTNIKLNKSLSILHDFLIPINMTSERSLVIIPDGILSTFPFDILIKDDVYLLENHELRYELSNEFLRSKTKNSGSQLLCVVPKYSNVKSEKALYASRGALNHLKFAKKEIQDISNTFNSVHTIEDLTPQTFNSEISKYNILHYCGHAIANGDDAYLAISDSTGVDDRIGVDQIMHSRNKLDMVVLSACETGLGEFKIGEGVRSLASAFLNSGSKSIIYSLWNANDQSTSDIMSRFYYHLNEGENKSSALRLAKREYLTSASPEQAHPYYWSGFNVVGDDAAIIEKSNFYVYFSCLLFLFLLFPFLKTKFRL